MIFCTQKTNFEQSLEAAADNTKCTFRVPPHITRIRNGPKVRGIEFAILKKICIAIKIALGAKRLGTIIEIKLCLARLPDFVFRCRQVISIFVKSADLIIPVEHLEIVVKVFQGS